MRRQPSIVELVGVLDRTLFSWGFIKLNTIARKLMMLAICAVCLLSTGCYRIAALALGVRMLHWRGLSFRLS